MPSDVHPVARGTKHTVQCANPASLDSLKSSVRLGPLDHFAAPFIPVAVVFVYKAHSGGELIPVDRLQQALALLLDHYPHLTGRLTIRDVDGIRNIDRLGTGAELFEAKCDAPLDAFSSPDHDGRIVITSLPAGGNALLPPFDHTLEGTRHEALLAIQHTRFACGGVSLGVRLYHTTCDSAGFFQLVHNLAEIYRGIRNGSPPGVLSRPPHVAPYLADESENMTPEERQAALSFKPLLYYVEEKPEEGSIDAGTENPSPPPPPPVIGRVMRFSSRELDALKAHATDPTTGWVSTFEALAAHIHQRVYRARIQLPSASPSNMLQDFLTPINVRSRLCLPSTYFPNCVLTTSAPLSHELLAGADVPLSRVAKAIHDLTRCSMVTDEDELQRTVRWFAAQPDPRRPKDRFRYGNGSIMVSQWSKFPIYAGADFDVDERGEAVPPALVAPPYTAISSMDGLVYLLPTEEQFQRGVGKEGSCDIDVYLPLSEPVWPILEQDTEFRRFRHV